MSSGLAGLHADAVQSLCKETRMKGPRVANTRAPTVGTTSDARLVTQPTTRLFRVGPFLAAAAAGSALNSRFSAILADCLVGVAGAGLGVAAGLAARVADLEARV